MAHSRHPLVAFLVLLLAVSACSNAGDSPSTDAASAAPTDSPATPSPSAVAAFPAELTDDADRTVTIEAEPERIVSLAPSNTEIVCALDACDRLVGVTDFDDYPPEVADVTDVVIQTQVDVELIVDAEPDLVLAAGNELTPSTVIEQLEELGLTVLVLYPESLDEVYDDIQLVATALDATDAADALVGDMEERVAAVEEAVADADRPLTLYEVFYSEGTTYTAGEALVPRVADRHRRRRAGDRRRHRSHRRGVARRGRSRADPPRKRLVRPVDGRSRRRARDGCGASRLGRPRRGPIR